LSIPLEKFCLNSLLKEPFVRVRCTGKVVALNTVEVLKVSQHKDAGFVTFSCSECLKVHESQIFDKEEKQERCT